MKKLKYLIKQTVKQYSAVKEKENKKGEMF